MTAHTIAKLQAALWERFGVSTNDQDLERLLEGAGLSLHLATTEAAQRKYLDDLTEASRRHVDELRAHLVHQDGFCRACSAIYAAMNEAWEGADWGEPHGYDPEYATRVCDIAHQRATGHDRPLQMSNVKVCSDLESRNAWVDILEWREAQSEREMYAAGARLGSVTTRRYDLWDERDRLEACYPVPTEDDPFPEPRWLLVSRGVQATQ